MSRQLGLQHHKPRLCPRIHGHSPILLHSSSNPNSSRQTATSGTGKRNPNPPPETGNLQGSTKGSEEGIPLIILSDSQKEPRRVAPHPKSQTAEPVYQTPKIPDGNTTYSPRCLTRPSLGSIYRPARRILPCADSKETRSLPSVPLRRKNLRIPLPPVRPIDSPKGIHKDSKGSCLNPTEMERPDLCLPRRLAHSGSLQRRGHESSPTDPGTCSSLGVPDQSNKVRVGTIYTTNLPRHKTGPPTGYSETYAGKNSKSQRLHNAFSSCRKVSSQSMATPSGADGKPSRHCSLVQIEDETHTTPSPLPLPAKGTLIKASGTNRPAHSISPSVVAELRQPRGGSSLRSIQPKGDRNNRCIQPGLGSTPWHRSSCREMELAQKDLTY